MDETVLIPGRNRLFWADGAGHGGVGHCIFGGVLLSFHLFSFRSCSLLTKVYHWEQEI